MGLALLVAQRARQLLMPIAIAMALFDGFNGKITLLTSGITGSAAEAFIYYLRAGHHDVTLIGESTRGAQSGPSKWRLPNGSSLLVPNRKITSPDGEYRETTGFLPQVSIESFNAQDIANSQDRLLNYFER